MSENNVQNEQELWDVLSEPVTAEPKTEPARKAAPKSKEGRFAKPGPMKEVAPAPKQEGRKLDGFFFTCMAGVAAVSVVATLVIGGMTGTTDAPSADVSALTQENTELRQQLALQRQQIQDLRAELMDLTGSTEGLPDDTAEAYDIFHQIQAAYEDFDRAKLESLIPEMDKRLEYLSSDALYEYYQILEYVEQPSNG